MLSVPGTSPHVTTRHPLSVSSRACDLHRCSRDRLTSRFGDGAEYGRYSLQTLLGVRDAFGLSLDVAAQRRCAMLAARSLVGSVRDRGCSCVGCVAESRLAMAASEWLVAHWLHLGRSAC